LAASLAATVLVISQGAVAGAAMTAKPGPGSPARVADRQAQQAASENLMQLAGRQQAGNLQPYKQLMVREFTGLKSCSKRTPSRVKLPDGREATVTWCRTKVDTRQMGKRQPAIRPRTTTPGASSSTAQTPPSWCPVTPRPNLAYNRFDLCAYMYYQYQYGGNLPGSIPYSVLVDFTVEMWGELSNQSRTWVVTAEIIPTTVNINPPTIGPVTATGTLGCDDPVARACTVSPTGTVGLGTAQAGVPLTYQWSLADPSTTTATLTNVLALDFNADGAPCPACISTDHWFGNPQVLPIRCDSQGTQKGFTEGCAVWVDKPQWTVTDRLYPPMGLVVKHMALATGNLPGFNGLPGLPGVYTPLTYINSNSTQAQQNYQVACGSATPPPGEPPANNTCDEYPLKSTEQGAASGGPYSICWVPSTANASQGGNFNNFLYSNRMLVDDQFYVKARYFGNNPGCSSNLGGGGSLAPDNTLDSMFGDYGDNATCADWSGGDATNSVDLGSGYRAWFFSDTFLNNQAARKSLWYSSGLHNSIVIQNSSGLRTITGGNTCQETNLSKSFWDRYAITPAAAPDAGGFFWTGDQMLVGSNVVKFYYHGHPYTTPNGGTSFVIDYPAVASLPVSSLENNSVMTISPAAFSCGGDGIIWGTSLLNWTDGYVYVYGVQQTGLYDSLYLARTPAADLANPASSSWQLLTALNGTTPQWGTCSGVASPLAITDAAGASVASINGSLWDIQFDYTNGQLNTNGAIGAHPASTPWGFTNNTVPLYDPPTDSLTYPYWYQEYEARIQPGLGAAGQDVISYNVNTSAVDTGCISANAHDPTIYRPRFIDVPVSDFNPALARLAPVPAMSAAAARNATARTTTATPNTARTRTRTPNTAGIGFAYGIHNSLPPFAAHHLPVPAPAPASARPAPARSTSVKPAAASTSATASATTNGIDGSTDWFEKQLGGTCPQVSSPSSAPSTIPSPDGIVTTTWQNVGTDVWYYAWVCDETKNNCSAEGTSSPWFPAWPYQNSYLWSTEPSAPIDPIGAVLAGGGQASNGDTFAIYIHSFGAGNGGAGGNSPEASVTVSIPPK
jgi:hypothetical protein